MTIKIGDRVRMTDSYDDKRAETDGTVMRANGVGSLHVKFDAPFRGHGEDDRCWNVPASKLALVAESVAAPARYKVGDKVRMSDSATYFTGCDVTIKRVDANDDVMPYFVEGAEDDSMWVYARDIVGLAEPAVAKVGDWVKVSDGDIGIVFHDDGDGFDNLHVGFIVNGGFGYYSAARLTVVPAGTTKSANDNAPILAEIDTLQARIDGLRASLA